MGKDPEIQAMETVSSALSKLDEETVGRVLRWAADRHKITLGVRGKAAGSDIGRFAKEEGGGSGQEFQDFPTLYNAVNPSTDAEKVLVAGYWFQAVKNQNELHAQQLNSELKHLGHPVSNVTAALTDLMQRQPRLVLQTRKSGTTRQARKKYKLTTEGIRKVQSMLAGAGELVGSAQGEA